MLSARCVRRSIAAGDEVVVSGRFLRLLGLLAAGLALSSCAPGFRRDLTDRLPTAWARVPLDSVPVLLPASDAARAVGARARSTGDIYRSYQVVLANQTSLPGENRLFIDVETVPTSILGALDRPERPFHIPLYTEERLNQTLEREFPDLETKIADAARRNRYGDYDYAVAYTPDGACVLAWQLIDDRRRTLPETIAMIRLEWRVCGTGQTPASLLRPFERLTLTAAPDILEVEGGPLPDLTEPVVRSSRASGAGSASRRADSTLPPPPAIVGSPDSPTILLKP